MGQAFSSCLPFVKVIILEIVLLVGSENIWLHVVDARVGIKP